MHDGRGNHGGTETMKTLIRVLALAAATALPFAAFADDKAPAAKPTDKAPAADKAAPADKPADAPKDAKKHTGKHKAAPAGDKAAPAAEKAPPADKPAAK
jgi:hypothetical protein